MYRPELRRSELFRVLREAKDDFRPPGILMRDDRSAFKLACTIFLGLMSIILELIFLLGCTQYRVYAYIV